MSESRFSGFMSGLLTRPTRERNAIKTALEKTASEKMVLEARREEQGEVLQQHQKTMQELTLESEFNELKKRRAIGYDARGGDSIGDAQSLMSIVEDYNADTAATGMRRDQTQAGIAATRAEISNLTAKVRPLDIQNGSLLHQQAELQRRSAAIRQTQEQARQIERETARMLQNRVHILQTLAVLPTPVPGPVHDTTKQ